MTERVILIGLAIVFAGCYSCVTAAQAKLKPHYWALGAGSYGCTAGDSSRFGWYTDLDRARMDWVLVSFGNPPNPGPEANALLNRFLELNPKLKIMVRVWPVNNLGWPETNWMATLLDYLYKPGVKEKLLEETSRQIRSVLDGVSKPENVVAFTFLEELPYHFAHFGLDVSNPDKLPKPIERYKQKIEADLGKDFKWDLKAKRWWGRKYVQVYNEINAHIKRESGGRWVFTWLQANHDTLDWNEDISQAHVFPFFYRDVIQPGVADGFFAYPVNRHRWQRYLDLARKNNWPFFSQLSHPGQMRLDSWADSVAMVKEKVPQNLGYFFFSGALTRLYPEMGRYRWNEDPATHAGQSRPANYRHAMAREKVGMDVLARNLTPEVQVRYKLTTETMPSYVAIQIFIRNRRDLTWYLSDAEATLRNVTLHIARPADLVIDPDQPAATLAIGDLGPGHYTTAVWWLRTKGSATVSVDNPIRVRATADGCEPVTVTCTTMVSTIPPLLTHEVSNSGDRWVCPGFEITTPVVFSATIEGIGDPITHPVITINGKRFLWMGCVLKGQTLVLGPGREARLKDASNPDGRDVSDRVGGRILRFGGGDDSGAFIYEVTYTDDDGRSNGQNKARITLGLHPVP